MTKEDKINKLCELCLRIANIVDRHEEKDEPSIHNECNLGYRAVNYPDLRLTPKRSELEKSSS